MNDIIKSYIKKGINFELIDGKLNVLSDIEITDQILIEIKLNKEGIIDYLNKNIFDNSYQSIAVIPSSTDYALSSAQRRLWVLNKFEGAETAYNIPELSVLEGSLNEDIFQKAYTSLLERHEVLRTRFIEDAEGTPRQEIVPIEKAHTQIAVYDYRKIANQVEVIKQQIEGLNNTVFDLSSGPLIKCSLLRIGDQRYVWSLVMHHIVSDGWSMGVLHKELSSFYNAYTTNQEPSLAVLSIQYKDYAAWHNEQLSSEAINAHKDYWLKQFEGDLPVLELAIDKVRPKVMTYNGASIHRQLSKETLKNLKSINQKEGGTLFMSLLTCLNVLLNKYTGQEDIIIGSPIAGREHPDLENQIGFYINTLALRTQFDSGDSFLGVYRKVKQNTLAAYEHQVYPYDALVDALALTRDTSRNPLFDVMLVLQNIDQIDDEKENLIGLNIKEFSCEFDEKAKLDLTFYIQENNEGLYIYLSYNKDIYSTNFVTKFINHFVQLIELIEEIKTTSLGSIDILTLEEKTYLLETLNDTKVAYPEDKTIVDLFEEQVVKIPDNIAVVFEDTKISYQELNELSNQLADYLRTTYSIKPDDLVGIKLERSEWMIVSILGILKSGGAYVPIDSEYPQDRIDYIVADSQCKVVIDAEELNKFKQEQKKYSKVSQQINLLPCNLMYCIYTSGSTGNPKGVLIEHNNVSSFLLSNKVQFNVQGLESYISVTSFTFDISVLELIGSLIYGLKLYLIPNVNYKRLLSCLKFDNHIGLQITPSYLNELLELPDVLDDLIKLDTLLVGGEFLGDNLYSKLKENLPHTTILNVYGPTEATIWSSFLPVKFSNKLSIGKPLNNEKLYILDKHHHLVPYGSIGEICIGGAGLARGYLNREELTKEKFIDNPYKPGERIYKTGDLGRWNEDNNLEYLGRVDDQVKIRGYRIELGEIESVLSQHGQVTAAVVVAKAINGAEKELIAYTTGEAEAITLKAYLKEKLPSYMVPSYYLKLDAIPLTSNGKVNRKALPMPEGTGIEFIYIAPKTATEKTLVKIWSEVLSSPIEKIGLEADFFAMGGHSIKAIRLLGLVHKELGVKLALKDLFSQSTLSQQALLISNATKQTYESIATISTSTDYALSSAQRRLWVLNKFEGAETAYNMPELSILEGVLNEDIFQKAYTSLLERHEVLRTRFIEDLEGTPRQDIVTIEEADTQITIYDYRGIANQQDVVSQQIALLNNTVFDLSSGPLIKFSLLRIGDQEYVWSLVMHHIVSDGWSMGVLHRELSILYNSYQTNQEPNLPDLTIQYKDYASWHNEQLASESITLHKEYWLKQFEGELPVLELASDKSRPKLMTYNGTSMNKQLSKETLNNLKAINQQEGGTLFMSLLTCLNVLLHKYTGQQDIVIGSPIAGREHPDLENQIGFYLGALPLRTTFSSESSLKELYQLVKQNTLGAFEHQVYPYDALVDALELTRDTSRNPLFDVWLDFHGDEITTDTFKLDGIERKGFATDGQLLTKFDLTFIFSEIGEEGLEFYMEYNTDLYSKNQMDGLYCHMVSILDQFAAKFNSSVHDIELLTESETTYLLETLNATKVDYPKDKTIVDLFEEQVAKTPDNIAVVFEETKLKYQELNELSNQLADYLRTTYRIQPDDLIGIKLDRSEWMIISILGILKSGGAYVPIDPDYPQDRIDYMVQDSACKVLLDEEELEMFKLQRSRYSKQNKQINLLPTNLMYCIYTSGSTGNPKGVLVEYRSVVNLASSYFLNRISSVSLTCNYVFDVSVLEIFSTLINGATLYTPSRDIVIDKYSYLNFINKHKIETTYLHPFFLDIEINDIPKSLINLLIGVEPIRWNKLDSFLFNSVSILNGYGPTEGTVCSTFFNVDSSLRRNQNLPIGIPIQNTAVYILNKHHHLVPYGSIGEICIGGAGLARGYLNREELTREKFIENPYKPGERIYKTGDLGRWRDDGNLEYLGRIDDQVKIRGYRIELGEIESVLSQHAQVTAALVVAKAINDSEKELIAYTTGEAEAITLKDYLKEKLPSYMVPSYYVKLASIPLTSNGKVNRKALPMPEGTGISTNNYIAPSTDTEKTLAKIWSEVLSLPEDILSIKADFFEIGGNSLKAIRLISRIHSLFGVKLIISDLFLNTDIETLSIIIESLKSNFNSNFEIEL